jgi:hypothetical protein
MVITRLLVSFRIYRLAAVRAVFMIVFNRPFRAEFVRILASGLPDPIFIFRPDTGVAICNRKRQSTSISVPLI